MGMTPESIEELRAAAVLPPGYEMVVKPQRKFQDRNLWSIRIYKDGERVFGRAAYPSSLLAAVVAAQRWAWERNNEGVREWLRS